MPEVLNSTIDSVLGFVTVVLVLSLIMQALQNLIKKLLRMKSRQAEQSLKLLFDYVLTQAPTKYTKVWHASPVLSAAVNMLSREKDESPGDTLVKVVKDELLELGRKSFWGNALLDSVSKDDLKRILSTVDPQQLGLDVAAIQQGLQAGQTLEAELKKAIDAKVQDIEKWYDAVMPGIAERYERGMKWMAFALSLIVVILLNANAITIYKYVASDSAVQQQLLQYAEKRIEERRSGEPKQSPANPSAAPGGSSTVAPTGSGIQPQEASTEPNPASGQPPPETPVVTASDLQQDIQEIRNLYYQYRRFGLTPFNWREIMKGLIDWRALLGWLVMTLLLSLGAPFWEDVLESVFGLKNVLRRRAKPE